MDRVGLAMGRILFFIMLFVSTACNKVDRSLANAEVASPKAEVVAADQARVRELDERVRFLEAQLQAMNDRNAAYSSIPGGANWD